MHCGVQCEVRYTLSVIVHVYVTPSLWSCSDVWDVAMFKLHCTHWYTSCTGQLLVSPLHDLQHNYEWLVEWCSAFSCDLFTYYTNFASWSILDTLMHICTIFSAHTAVSTLQNGSVRSYVCCELSEQSETHILPPTVTYVLIPTAVSSWHCVVHTCRDER